PGRGAAGRARGRAAARVRGDRGPAAEHGRSAGPAHRDDLPGAAAARTGRADRRDVVGGGRPASPRVPADPSGPSGALRAARRLLGLGPVVGGCWVAALVTSRAWPGPAPTRVVLGLVLVSCIGLLAMAALGRRYRVAFYSGVAGCIGFAALDASLIVGVLVVAGVTSWVTAVAVAVSSARIAFCARATAAAAQQNT